jgi:hypothetical protein
MHELGGADDVRKRPKLAGIYATSRGSGILQWVLPAVLGSCATMAAWTSR